MTVLSVGTVLAPPASAAARTDGGRLTGPTGVCAQFDPFGDAVGVATVFSDNRKPSDGNVRVVVAAEKLAARQAYEVLVAESIGGNTPGCGADLVGTAVTSGSGKLRFDGRINRNPGNHALQVFVKVAGQEQWMGYATEPLTCLVP